MSVSLSNPLAPIIGREQVLAALEAQITRPDVHLLTLTGSGGVGKTHLMLHLVQRVKTFFPAGVFVVSLAPIMDAALVMSTIAQALGLYQTMPQSPLERLKSFFVGDQLLVLDNFEQVLSAAVLINELLTSCPKLKLLVTSRERLHLSAEYEFPVQPLAVPNPEELPTLGTLAQYGAIALFVQRAQAIKPEFQLTTDNAPMIARICAQLEGLPLALELAAARIKLLPPNAMLNRLKNRLHLLTDGPIDLPVRQQNLRDTLAWSYNLLELGEQRLFRRLGVFVGGCTLDAVEAITNRPDELPLDVLSHVSALIDKSLLRQVEQSDGEPRLFMLETTREYALEQLQLSGDELLTRRDHAHYYWLLAQTAEPHLLGLEQSDWIERLEREHNNLRVALRWAANSDDTMAVEIGLKLGKALWQFWAYRGYLDEGRDWLATLLALPIAQYAELTSVRASALVRAGLLAIRYSDFAKSRELLEAGLALSQGQDAALALDGLGWVYSAFGQFDRAKDLYNASLQLHHELATMHTSEAADVLAHLSMAEVFDGSPSSARPLSEESLRIKRRLGERWGIAFALYLLGCIGIQAEQFAEAHRHLVEGFNVSTELGVPLLRIFTLEGLAWLAIASPLHRQPQLAAQVFGATDKQRTTLGAPQPPQWKMLMQTLLQKLQTLIEPEAFVEAWSTGQQQSLDQVFVLCRVYPFPAAETPRFSTSLSIREAEVLRLVAAGLTDAQVAEKLVVSVRTVNAHLQSIYNKLGVNSRTGAVRQAIELRLL